MVEGITDYYGDVLVLRAGRSLAQEFLDSLSDKIEELQTTPGRAVRSVTQASMDAWIKLYRPDENTPNTAISYYTKGAVVAFLLDAKIRRATGGRRSLDEVMREAYTRFSATHGFTPDEFRALTEHVAGIDLGAFWRTAIEGTEELDYSEALEVFGLQFRPANGSPNGKPKAWIGATTKIDAGRLIVAQVKRDTPAFGAGLNVDDEIVAIDQVRVRTTGSMSASSNTPQAIASRCLWHAATVSSPSTSSSEPSRPEPGASSPGPPEGVQRHPSCTDKVSGEAVAAMRTPTAVLDLEISGRFTELNDIGDFAGALVLFRLHGRPLGWGAAPVTEGRLDRGALVRQLLEQHAWSCALPLAEKAVLSGIPPRAIDVGSVLLSQPPALSGGPLVTVAVCNRTPAAELQPCLDALLALDYTPLDLSSLTRRTIVRRSRRSFAITTRRFAIALRPASLRHRVRRWPSAAVMCWR